MQKTDLLDLIANSHSKSDAIINLGWPQNGTSARRLQRLIDKFDVVPAYKPRPRKWPTYVKQCPVCEKEFTAQKGHPKEKATCSYGCANTHFRSGLNHPNIANYQTICFAVHGKCCIICGEANIVAAHHYDHDHSNNETTNLVPLCPTHHQYVHSRFACLIKDQVDAFVNNQLV